MNGAVIVETRNVNIESVINRHMKYLPEWECTVFGWNNFSNIKLSNFDCHINYLNLWQNIHTSKEYNELLTNVEFWKLIPYDKILMFQSDSGILKEGIDQFLKWDWVGAPWTFQQFGGNGGLSIRSKEIMLEITKRFKYNYDCNEDVFFCNQMAGHRIGKLAPRSICEQFSVEAIYKLGTFGYHSIDKHCTASQCEKIYSQYD